MIKTISLLVLSVAALSLGACAKRTAETTTTTTTTATYAK